MESNLSTDNTRNIPPAQPYLGPSPAYSAFAGFVWGAAKNFVLFAAVGLVFDRLIHKTPLAQQVWARVKQDAPVNLVVSSAIGLWDGKNAYHNARAAAQQHDQLFADNVAMRSQLNQTAQILQHVANEVEQGHLKDSELTVNEDAPPSHVAKLEAQKAERAYEAAIG